MTSRPRRIGGIVLLVLAALLVPVAVIATWTARTVTDTDAFVARVVPVASSPEVQAPHRAGDDRPDHDRGDRRPGGADGQRGHRLDGRPDLVKGLLRDLAAGVGSAVESRTASVVTKVVEAPEFATAFEERHPHRPHRPGRDPRGRRTTAPS